MGTLLTDMNKFEEARIICDRALTGFEKTLGANNPDTLRMISVTAKLLYKQGKLEEARVMFERTLDGITGMSIEHPFTLYVVNNLVALLKDEGNLEEAKIRFENTLDADHPLLKHMNSII